MAYPLEYDRMLDVSEIELDSYACLQCGYCKGTCPAYDMFGWESDSPRGKMFYLKRLQERSILDKNPREMDPRFFEALYHCTSCGACDEVCHVDIKLSDVWEQVKEIFVREGFECLPGHKELARRIYDPERRNPFLDPNDLEKDKLGRRAAWIPGDLRTTENADVLYFVGCTASYRMQFLAEATVRLLEAADVKFDILGSDEWCCGSPLLRTGQGDGVKKEYVQHNIREVERRGASTLITACAGCFKTIKENYPLYYGKPSFGVEHITEFLADLIKAKKLEFTKEFPKKTAYHDPCHLGRHAGVFDAPRKVLRAIPGLELIEMRRNRENSRCCGAGGGFKIAFNEHAESIAADRVLEAKELRAEIIATPCPFCVVNLNAGAKKAGVDIKTMDVVQVAQQCL
ncbi:MAG: (Fe-S)-binding protein [Thermoplasmata archaeon]